MPDSSEIGDFMKSTLHGTVDDIHFEKETIGLEHIFKPKEFLNRESRKMRRQLLLESTNQLFEDLLQGLPSLSDRLEMSSQLCKRVLSSLPLTKGMILDPSPQTSSVQNEKGLKILLDGAPGVGKTTLCHNACKDWADNKVFTDFKLMVYVPLRENQVANAVEIEHLFCYGSKTLRQTVARELEDTDGEDVLLVLDGWDELSLQQRGKQSLLCRIIQRRVLPRCSVLITSRPYASNWLRNPKISSRHIEIFGFTEQQVSQCVQNMLHPVTANALLQKLEVRTDLKALCYIPMNLAMILYIYKALDFELPSTLTGVYNEFTNNALLRYLQEYDPCTEPVTLLKDRRALPDEIKQLFEALCQVAYDGLLKDQMVFSKEELESYHPLLTVSSNSLGLLTAFKGFTESGIDLKYQFLHLTIQEFLAAEALSQKSADIQTNFVMNHLSDIRFRTMLRFVFGKAQLDDIEKVLSFLFVSASNTNDNSRFLFLCHMLYEAQDIQAIRAVGRNQPPCTTKLTLGSNISLFDAMVIGRFLSSTSMPIKSIDMYNCHITRQQLKLLTNNLSHDCTEVSVEELYLETRGCTPSEITPFILHPAFRATRYLKIDLPNVPEIASVHCSSITMMPNLTGLKIIFRASVIVDRTVLSDPKEDVVLSLQILFEAISRNPKITFLDVCAIGAKKPELLNENCSTALANMIETRESPVSLHFSLSLYSRSFIERFSKYAAVSTRIQELHLYETNSSIAHRTDDGRITAGEAKILFNALKTNKSLQSFQLFGNKLLFGASNIDPEAAADCTQALEELLSTNSYLKTFGITKCHIQWPDITAISNGLRLNQTLTELCLDSIETKPDAVVEVLACNLTISSLTLSRCHLEDRHEPFISTMIQNGSIKFLNLSMNNFGALGAIGLFTTLQNSRVNLERLVLHRNRKLGESKQEMLAAAIELTLDCNQTLKTLDLDHCSLNALVVEGIATSLVSNNVLESLSLRENNITGTGVWQLCIALQVNTCLKKLYLRDSIILDSATTNQLNQVLKLNSTLESLYLQFDACFVDEKSLEIFVTTLQMNSSLTTLGITGLENSHVDKVNLDRTKQSISVLTIK